MIILRVYNIDTEKEALFHISDFGGVQRSHLGKLNGRKEQESLKNEKGKKIAGEMINE